MNLGIAYKCQHLFFQWMHVSHHYHGVEGCTKVKPGRKTILVILHVAIKYNHLSVWVPVYAVKGIVRNALGYRAYSGHTHTLGDWGQTWC